MCIVGFWNQRNWLAVLLTVGVFFMFGLSFYGLCIYGINLWVAPAAFFGHIFFFIGSVKLLQILRFLQTFRLYYNYSKFFPLTQRKNYFWKKSGTQTRIIFFWRHKRICSTETPQLTQCPIFSTTSQTYLSLLL